MAAGEAVLSGRVTRQLVERFGRRLPRTDDALAVLTEREAEVLRAVATGATNRQAAASLHVSEATVKTHLVHVFDKLGVDSRTAAVAVAREQGLLR